MGARSPRRRSRGDAPPVGPTSAAAERARSRGSVMQSFMMEAVQELGVGRGGAEGGDFGCNK